MTLPILKIVRCQMLEIGEPLQKLDIFFRSVSQDYSRPRQTGTVQTVKDKRDLWVLNMQQIVRAAYPPPEIQRECRLFNGIARTHAVPPPTQWTKEPNHELRTRVKATNTRNVGVRIRDGIAAALKCGRVDSLTTKRCAQIVSPGLDPAADVAQTAGCDRYLKIEHVMHAHDTSPLDGVARKD